MTAAHKVEVGRRLRVAIEAIEKSQAFVVKALHDSTGVTAPKLGNWLRGDNYPDEWFVKCFCDRFGVTTDWIYRGIVTGVASDRLADELWKAEQESLAASRAPAAQAIEN